MVKLLKTAHSNLLNQVIFNSYIERPEENKPPTIIDKGRREHTSHQKTRFESSTSKRAVSECPGDFSSFATVGHISKDSVECKPGLHLPLKSPWLNQILYVSGRTSQRRPGAKDHKWTQHFAFIPATWLANVQCLPKASKDRVLGDASGCPCVSR